MKTVSGKIASTKPISLSKAAKIISNFAASDHESSPAVTAYLARTSAAFDELIQFHKDLKSDRKKKHHSQSIAEEVDTVVLKNNKEENQASRKHNDKKRIVPVEQAMDPSEGNGSLRKTKKRKSEA